MKRIGTLEECPGPFFTSPVLCAVPLPDFLVPQTDFSCFSEHAALSPDFSLSVLPFVSPILCCFPVILLRGEKEELFFPGEIIIGKEKVMKKRKTQNDSPEAGKEPKPEKGRNGLWNRNAEEKVMKLKMERERS